MVKMIRNLLVLMTLVVGCVSFNQCSAEWVKAADSSVGAVYYVDSDSITSKIDNRIGFFSCETNVKIVAGNRQEQIHMVFYQGGGNPLMVENVATGSSGPVDTSTVAFDIFKVCADRLNVTYRISGHYIFVGN